MGKIIQNFLKLNPSCQHESRDMLIFQNKAPDTELFEISRKSRQSIYFENERFSKEACLRILRQPLDSQRQNESGGDLGSDSESRLPLHAKRCKLKLKIFTICIKTYNLLQTTPNINILYTVKKYFSPRVKIQNRYLQIKFYLTQINCQSFKTLFDSDQLSKFCNFAPNNQTQIFQLSLF